MEMGKLDRYAARAQVPLTVGSYWVWGYWLWPKGAIFFGSPENVNWIAVLASGFFFLGLASAAIQVFGLFRKKPSANQPDSSDSGQRQVPNVTLEEPSFMRDARAVYKSKLVVTFANSDEKSIHFLRPSWSSNMGDIGLQTPSSWGYWIYPKGKTQWIDATDPVIEPTERFHIWIGLDETQPDNELNARKRAKRLGTLCLPMEIEREQVTVNYRL